jgi:hypothetical protein
MSRSAYPQPKGCNSPQCEASKFPEPAPCSLQLLSHCSATLSHSLAAFKNNRLPIARRRCSPRPLLLPLGLCDNTQMIPFATTGTNIFHRPLFFLSRQKDFPSFESNSKGHISPFAILGFLAFNKDFIQ